MKRWTRKLWTWTKQRAITLSHSSRRMDSHVVREAIRFNKTNRCGAQGKDEDMDMDMEMAGGAGPIQSKLKEKQAKVVGQKYRAKKAGGDVKKKGRVDPYAYAIDIAAKDGPSLTNKSKADKRKNGKPGRRS